jgi:hypothetical protein
MHVDWKSALDLLRFFIVCFLSFASIPALQEKLAALYFAKLHFVLN